MNLIYRDEHLVVIEKESGMHVHPPEDKRIQVPRDKILLYLLREQLGTMVYPVHRLDAGTSGVLLMALSSDIASKLCPQFQNNEVTKKYTTVVRGYMPAQGYIERALQHSNTKKLVPAQTSYQCVAQIELDYSVNPKHPKSRYSLVHVQPHTGRYHQIRRHFNGIAHPIIGDAQHGDSRHNQFFREKMGIEGLCLRANELSFMHPVKQEQMTFSAPLDAKWSKIKKLFRFC